MKLTNVVQTRLADEDYAIIRRLAEREERRPADVVRRLIRQAIKEERAPDRRDGALVTTGP